MKSLFVLVILLSFTAIHANENESTSCAVIVKDKPVATFYRSQSELTGAINDNNVIIVSDDEPAKNNPAFIPVGSDLLRIDDAKTENNRVGINYMLISKKQYDKDHGVVTSQSASQSGLLVNGSEVEVADSYKIDCLKNR